MSVLKIFKNTPGCPMGGDRGPVAQATGDRTLIYFFLEFAKRSLAGGGGLSPPPTGDRGLSPPRGDRGLPLYITPGLHSLLI